MANEFKPAPDDLPEQLLPILWLVVTSGIIVRQSPVELSKRGYERELTPGRRNRLIRWDRSGVRAYRILERLL
jgi:hypothetical protein